MLKDIIQSFLPWILFFTLSGQSQQQLKIAIVIAAITSVVFEFKCLKKCFILSWGTLVFFVFMLIAVFIFKNQWICLHTWIFSNGTLAAIAWISILIQKPFTIQYAREQVSKDKWSHPIFLKINYFLTAVWGCIFLIGVVMNILKIYYPQLGGWSYEMLSYLPSIFGIWFSAWFPSWYKNKYIKNNT